MPDEDERIVEGEVIPPGGERRQRGQDKPKEPAPAKRRSFYHPLSGVVILGIDWLAFGMDLFSGFAALAAVSAVSFVVTFYVVLGIQRRLHEDRPGPALVKALIGALAAGLPFPVTGTIVGAAIIALSGLPTLPWRRRGLE
jgi:hypothetical protein